MTDEWDKAISKLTDRQARILRRFLNGGVPKCSCADFDAIDALAPRAFNMEGGEGRHGAFVLVALEHIESAPGFAKAEADRLLREYGTGGGGRRCQDHT